MKRNEVLTLLGIWPRWNAQYGRQQPLPQVPQLPQYHPQYDNQFIPSPAARTSNFHPVFHQRTSCECGRSSQEKQVNRIVNRMNKGERVIGGKEATAHLFPWIVRLGGGCAGGLCGGSLITRRLIATAFHCTLSEDDKTKPCDHSDGKRVAIIGAHDISKQNMEVPIIAVKTPPHATKPITQKNPESHDFALVVLESPVQWNDKGINGLLLLGTSINL